MVTPAAVIILVLAILAFFASPDSSFRQVVLISLAVGLGGLGAVAAVVAQQFASNIQELTGAAYEMQRGHYGPVANPESGDELEELAVVLNQISERMQKLQLEGEKSQAECDKECSQKLEHEVSERRRVEEELERVKAESQVTKRELAMLNEIASTASCNAGPNAVLEAVCRQLVTTFEVAQSAVALMDPDGTTLTVVAEYMTSSRPSAMNVVIPVEGNPATLYVMKHKTPLALADAQHDILLAPIYDIMKQRGVASILILPIIVQDQVIGTVGVDAIEPHEYSPDEIRLAMAVTNLAALTLKR